ncbi:hypothetical protein [Kushneria sp. TE3]|uniref:hypothetical protein n=1 Tax=Kushneria sp. TE3 TaxID=3449832 RepID=UPI003F687C0C
MSSDIFVLTSKQQREGIFFFSGLAILDDDLVLGQSGGESFIGQYPFTDVRTFENGRFLVARELKGKTIIKTDFFCQESIFIYRGRHYWALSNSLLALTRRLYDDGISLSFYNPSLLSFFVGNRSLWGGQPFTLNTIIKGVSVVPQNYHVEIDSDSKLDIVASKRQPLEVTSDNYREALESFIAKSRSIISTLGDNGYRFNLGISGGMDSRMNLALFIPCYGERDIVRFQTNQNKMEDLVVVEQLQEKCDFSLQGFNRDLTLASGATAYKNWQFGTMGNYLPINLPLAKDATGSVGAIHGGSFRGSMYRSRKPAERAAILEEKFNAENLAKSFSREFLSSFSAMGVSVDDASAMDVHYTNTRSRFHTGISWFRSLDRSIFAPQLSTDYFDIFESLNEQEKANDKLIHDVLSITAPTLLDVPFDEPDKGFHGLRSETKPSLQGISGLHEKTMTFHGEQALENKNPAKGRTLPELETEFKSFIRRDVDYYHGKALQSPSPMIRTLAEEAKEQTTHNISLAKSQSASLLIALGRFSELVGEFPMPEQG